MKRAIIIDDEKKSRIALSTFISKYCPSLEVVAMADGVKSGVDAIKKNNPDVVFLDIEMGDGNGFDVIEASRDYAYDVIFVTAYNQYALKAIKYSAIDYLLKPINPEELIKAVSKLSDNTRLEEIERKLETLLSNKSKLQRIAIPSMEGVRIEEIDNIAYCESDNYYTNVHLKSNEKLVVTKTLKEYEQLLNGEGFFRIHQKFLVNITYINNFSKADGGTVTLGNGAELSVARRKKEELLKLILE